MDEAMTQAPLVRRWGLPAILVFACAVRLLNLDAALLNGMGIKQVFVAHRARHIAGPPFALFNNQFDFLTEAGEPTILVEEFPLYPGLVAVAYRLFGEHEFLGRLLSVLATLIAIAAFYDLVRQELGEQVALLSALFFSLTPLLLFFGQAFQPDVSMLACMLLAACAYGRYIERSHWAWYLVAAAAGLTGALCKYYGLMVLIPLAFMTYRRFGRSRAGAAHWLGLAVAMCTPVLLWLSLVFLRARNPGHYVSYYIFQMPELLLEKTLYVRFFDRFLYKDCGPVLALLMLVGTWAVLRERIRSVTLLGWTVAGLLFFVLLGPMMRAHNYYELMMLPAASLCGALGWRHLWNRAGTRPHWLGLTVLIAMAVVHSPFILGGDFEQDHELLRSAESLKRHCSANDLLVVAGGCDGTEILHYSRRQGWIWQGALPADWQPRLERHRQQGAQLMLVYLNHDLTAEEQLAYRDVIASWPVLEKAEKTSVRGQRVEYFVLDLRSPGEKNLRLLLTPCERSL